MKHVLKAGLSVAVVLGLFQPLWAEESIDDLLKSYRKEADLSKQTKKENAGFVVVYTRDDLERMQVYRLSDLIKSMRFFRYDINSFGMTDPLQRNPTYYTSDFIKVYVNEHEITTGFSGSGLQFYGNIDMGMFDHVEIYQDSPVLDVATEPAAVVIKLYTKSPERENGGDLAVRLGDRGMQEVYLSHAKVLDEWSYYVYAQESENYFRHEHHLGTEISKDYRQQHLFLDLQRDRHRLELEYLGQKHDPFTSQSMMITPTGGNWEMPFYRASYSGEWMDGSLHTDLSYIYSDIDLRLTSASPFWGELFEPFYPYSLLDPREKHFHLKASGDLLTAKAYHERTLWDRHQFKVGVEYRYKKTKNSEYTINAISDEERKASFNIGSVYLQDQVGIYENSMLSLSVKLNYYDFERRYRGESDTDTMTTWQGRLAYSVIRDRWHLKMFATHVEFPTQLFEILMHDAALDSQKYNTLSGEVKHIDDSDEWRVTVSGSQAKDIAVVNPFVAEKRTTLADMNLLNSTFDYTHRFDADHRLDFNLYWTHFDKKMVAEMQRNYLGGFVRLLDTFGDWDIFNELIYRQRTSGLDAGWDYNAGVKYHATKDLTFALKGVNIFNKAKKSNFYTLDISNPAQPVFGEKTLQVVDQQFYFTVEWLF